MYHEIIAFQAHKDEYNTLKMIIMFAYDFIYFSLFHATHTHTIYSQTTVEYISVSLWVINIIFYVRFNTKCTKANSKFSKQTGKISQNKQSPYTLQWHEQKKVKK